MSKRRGARFVMGVVAHGFVGAIIGGTIVTFSSGQFLPGAFGGSILGVVIGFFVRDSRGTTTSDRSAEDRGCSGAIVGFLVLGFVGFLTGGMIGFTLVEDEAAIAGAMVGALGGAIIGALVGVVVGGLLGNRLGGVRKGDHD